MVETKKESDLEVLQNMLLHNSAVQGTMDIGEFSDNLLSSSSPDLDNSEAPSSSLGQGTFWSPSNQQGRHEQSFSSSHISAGSCMVGWTQAPSHGQTSEYILQSFNGSPCSRPATSADLATRSTSNECSDYSKDGTTSFKVSGSQEISTISQSSQVSSILPSQSQNFTAVQHPESMYCTSQQGTGYGSTETTVTTSQPRGHISQYNVARYSGICSILGEDDDLRKGSIPSNQPPPFSGHEQGTRNSCSQTTGPDSSHTASTLLDSDHHHLNGSRKIRGYDKKKKSHRQSVKVQRSSPNPKDCRYSGTKSPVGTGELSKQKENVRTNHDGENLIQMIFANAQKRFSGASSVVNFAPCASGYCFTGESMDKGDSLHTGLNGHRHDHEERPKKAVEQNPLLFKLLSEND